MTAVVDPDLISPGTIDPTIWRNRDFLLLWLAQAISQTAQNVVWYGILVLVQSQSNSRS